jgi:signal transduction histidine kinase
MMDGEIEGIFEIRGDKVHVRELTRTAKREKRPPKKQIIPLDDFLDRVGQRMQSIPRPNIGPVEVRIRLYNIGEGLTPKATKALVSGFLEQNAGVRVYRDGVRVLPYGDPDKAEGDWLELAQRKAGGRAAVTRIDWRIEANRIVGAVIIGRDSNPDLHDASGREGLITNEAFTLLRLFVLNCVRHMEIAYHRLRDAPIAAKEAIAQPRKVVRFFKKYAEDLNEDLKTLEKALPKSQKYEVEKVRARIESHEKKTSELSASLSEILDQALTYRGLATLGIAHASFGHEIQMSAGQFVDAAHAANLELDPPPNIKKAKAELAKAIEHGERISTWGNYTLTRVNAARRKTKDEPLHDIINQLIEEIAPFFAGSAVKLEPGTIDTITDNVITMDVESMVINLLTNAYDFVKESDRTPRKVVVNLRRKTRDGAPGYEVTVGDSGPGVPAHIREDIWRPLFTTKKTKDNKPKGTGLGLAIVENIVKDLGGHREVGIDPELGGALFTIWLPNHPST